MRPEFRAVRALFLLIPLWFATASASAAQTQVPLAPGDTIVFSILGAPHLNREAMIGVDGTVHLPIVGTFKAADLTIDELRAEISVLLLDRTYRVMGAGGEDVWRRMQEEEIFLDIAQYRPVYVTGDVREPGEVAFRPGMSVRQAMAVTGGVGRPVQEGSDDEVLRLLAERRQLMGRLETQIVEVERYRADLDQVMMRLASKSGTDTPSPDDPDTEITAEEAEKGVIREIAQRWLDARSNLRELADKGNDLLLDRMEKRLEVLEALEDAGEQNLTFVQEELDRVNQLAERGVVPTSRITEAQSSLLQASTRALETSGEVLRLRLDMTRFAEDAKAALTTEQVRLLDEVLNSTARLNELRLQLEALDNRLVLLGAISTDEQEASVDMKLFRASSGGSAEGIVARPDMVMYPGDVLDVTLSLPEAEIATQ